MFFKLTSLTSIACKGTLLSALALGLQSCAPAAQHKTASAPDYTTAADEFSVMTYNVYRYGYHDRDDDGQKDDFKDAEECNAVLQIIADNKPDILLVEEMGSPSTFSNFVGGLKNIGADYPYAQLMDSTSWKHTNLGLLSKYPITEFRSLTNDVYKIGDIKRRVSRGFIDADIQINPNYKLRVMGAHLKSKMFHELGQTEIRRNEARLLHNHVKDAIEADPEVNLVVLGDMNDIHFSKAVRILLGEDVTLLKDLRPKDWQDDIWSHYRKYTEEYSRIDYIMVNEGLAPELVESKTRAVRHPLTYVGSDHRPIVAVFKAENLPTTPFPQKEKAKEVEKSADAKD